MTINATAGHLTRYIYVDPFAQKLEARFVHLDVAAMYNIIGCASLDSIRLPNGDTLWFDGEPVEYEVVLDGFEVAGTPVLGSHAMITGPDHPGKELPGDCNTTEADATAMVVWKPQRRIVGDSNTAT